VQCCKILTRCPFTDAQLERMDRQTHERNGTKIVVCNVTGIIYGDSC